MESLKYFKSGMKAIALSVTLACVGLGESPLIAQQQPESSRFGIPKAAAQANPSAFSDQLLMQARRALVENDLKGAENFVAQAKTLQLTYKPNEDRPEYVEALIALHKDTAAVMQTNGDTAAYRRARVELLSRQADGFFRKGDYDTAERVAQLALAQFQSIGDNSVPLNGMNPSVLLAKIADKKAEVRASNQKQYDSNRPAAAVSLAVQNQLNDVSETLAKARTALNLGDLNEADRLCRSVQSLNIPETAYPNGMTKPSQLLGEIAAKRQGAFAPVNGMFSQQETGAIAQAGYNSENDTTSTRQVSGASNDFVMQSPSPFVSNSPEAAPPIFLSEIAAPAMEMRPAAQMQMPMPPSLLDQSEYMERNAAQQLAVEIGQKISSAYRTHETDPQSALAIIAQARAHVESSNADAVTKAQTLKNLDFTAEQLQKRYDQNKGRIELEQRNQAVLAEVNQNRENKDFVEQRLKELVAESNQLIEQGRFEEAVFVAGKARELAPENPVTAQLVLVTKTLMNKNAYESNRIAKADGFIGAMNEVDKAAIPHFGDSPMSYDPLRRTLASKRPGFSALLESQRPEAEKEILRKLEMPVTLDFDEPIALGEALRYLMGIAQVNIVQDQKAIRDIGVASDQQVRVSFPRAISLKSALNIILNPLNLTYVIENESLTITSRSATRGKLSTKHYYVGDLVTPVPHFKSGDNPNSLRNLQKEATQSLSPAQRVPSGGRGASVNLNTSEFLGQVASGGASGMGRSGNGQGLNFGNANSGMNGAEGGGMNADFSTLINIIEQVIQPDSWNLSGSGGGGLGVGGGTGTGGGTMQPYYQTLSLIISQTEEIHSQIVDLLAQLRKLNDLQVTVEVRYITLSDKYFERMGIDFQMNIPNKQFSRTDVNATPNTGESFVNRPNVNNSVVGVDQGTMFTQAYDIPMRQSTLGFAQPTFGGFDPSVGLSAGFAILSDIESYFFITAAQANNRSNVLQAPKVTIFNGQMASINDTTEQPFVTSVIPVVGDFAAGYQPVIVIVNEGNSLDVHAVVSSNRQFVKITLNPTFTKIIDATKTFRYTGEDESSTEDTSKEVSNSTDPTLTDEDEKTSTTSRRSTGVTVQQPVIASTSVSTTVSVPDGGTILLGGIKRLSEGRSEAGTPILDKVPFLKRLFTNTGIGRETTSLMLIVTPRIIIQEEEEANLMGSAAVMNN